MKNPWRLPILFVLCVIIINTNPNILTYFAQGTGVSNTVSPKVTINIEPFSVIYEGDIIDCNIIGNPDTIYWQIDNCSYHTTFYDDNPVIYNPEPTPIDVDYVNLTVYAENDVGSDSDTVKVMIKRIFFGDIHWHTKLCDGANSLDVMLKNALKDNYLDFVSYSGHAEWLDGYMNLSFKKPFWNPTTWVGNLYGLKFYLQNWLHYKIYGYNDWLITKQKANEYYKEGRFTTLLGFEWTPFDYPNFHINFYYRDVYSEALEYSSSSSKDDKNCKPTFDDIFQAMVDEWEKGHLNIGFPHHPQVVKTNWTYFSNNINEENRDKILRGVEVYSAWGNAIGNNYTPELPYLWPYNILQEPFLDEAWVENALWEWSNESKIGQKFVLMAGSDTHFINRPGSADPIGPSEGIIFRLPYDPSGITAAYAVHNNRSEIWDAMNDCDIYASQLLKIRANVRFNDQLSYGRWINCSNPLTVRITAHSTFPGVDSSGRSMCPYGYSPDKLDFPISDVWLIKKDEEKGKPWCKVINHSTINTDMAVVFFEDYDVQPNDFYWVAIRQKGDLLLPSYIPKIILRKLGYYDQVRDEYMTFIGPVFIENVIDDCDK